MQEAVAELIEEFDETMAERKSERKKTMTGSEFSAYLCEISGRHGELTNAELAQVLGKTESSVVAWKSKTDAKRHPSQHIVDECLPKIQAYLAVPKAERKPIVLTRKKPKKNGTRFETPAPKREVPTRRVGLNSHYTVHNGLVVDVNIQSQFEDAILILSEKRNSAQIKIESLEAQLVKLREEDRELEIAVSKLREISKP